jgi:predicted Zn finger-like uncharacterized protein
MYCVAKHMEVQCDQCKTEYEFDEALLSARGTTVKCTECNFAFKVHVRSATEEDRWRITNLAGETRLFMSLSGLQKAILEREVLSDDSIRKGAGASRRIGDIAELATFFHSVPEPPVHAPVHELHSAFPSENFPAHTHTHAHGPGVLRAHEPSLPEPEEVHSPSFARQRRRAGVGGWGVGLLLLLGVLGGGAYWVQRYTAQHAEAAKGAAPETTVTTPLQIRAGAARSANIEADLAWLQLRVCENEAERARFRVQFESKLAPLRLAAADLDLDALTRVDSLRLVGDLALARALVPKVDRTLPEAAHVLASLDWLEAEPPWPTIVDRLRSAAALESAPSRSSAALVAALAESRDLQNARIALGRAEPKGALTNATAISPELWKALGRYVARAEGTLESSDASVRAVIRADAASEREVTDPRVMVAEASKAIQRGDRASARRLYAAALRRNEQDSEALAGMGDVELASGNQALAGEHYQKALDSNPNFLPALIAVADLEYRQGAHGKAAQAYRDIVNRFPESSYPSRVRERATVSESAPLPAPTETKAVTPEGSSGPAPSATSEPQAQPLPSIGDPAQ